MQHSSGLAKHRLERAKEHFQSAKELLANNHFLDSISRSYYAVFTAARAVLATVDKDKAKNACDIKNNVPVANESECKHSLYAPSAVAAQFRR
jgi:uncharacterized protein (UPF0332 family)